MIEILKFLFSFDAPLGFYICFVAMISAFYYLANSKGYWIPVLMGAAVIGLCTYTAQYLIKPFLTAELAAREAFVFFIILILGFIIFLISTILETMFSK